MAVVKLTALGVKRLRPPTKGKKDYWDDTTAPGGLKNFGVRVNAGGKKSWIANTYVGGKPVPMTIGPIDMIPLAEARDIAREAMRDARLKGIHPNKAKKAQAAEEKAASAAEKAQERADSYTLRKLVADYLPWSQRTHRPNTSRNSGYLLHQLLRQADFGDQPAAQITTQQIKDYGYAVPPGEGDINHWNQVVALGRVYQWALKRGRVPSSPVAGIEIEKKSKPRQRVLTDAELRAFWIAAGKLGYPWGPCFQLMALTGQRETEVAAMPWRELDLDAGIWLLPPERTKNKEWHRVPLPQMAIDILRGLPKFHNCPYVFTTNARSPIVGFNYQKKKLIPALGASDWTWHDLRRTFATNMAARLKVPVQVTEGLLNHRGGSRAGIVQIYQTYDYWDERVQAMNDYAKFLAWLVEDRPPVTLRA